jgi:hypothetical protein
MIIEIILLVLAIPTGFLIAWMARDELVDGKNWFKMLVVASIVLAGLFWIFGFAHISLTCVFIAIVSFVSIVKSSDKKWTKKRL